MIFKQITAGFLVLASAGCGAATTSSGNPSAGTGSIPATTAAPSAQVSAPTPVSTSTPPPTVAVLEPGTYAQVVTTDLVYRTAPRIADDSAILGKLELDARVYVAEGPVESNGYQWFLVQVEQTWTHGWVAAAGKDGEDWLRPLDRAAGQWVAVTEIPDAASRHNFDLAVAGDGEHIYLVGGLWPRPNFGTTVAPSLVYTLSTDEWKTLPEMPTPRLYSVAVVGADKNLYVIGGSGWYGDYPADSPRTMEFYSPSTGRWHTGPEGPDVPSVEWSNAAAVSTEDGLIYLLYDAGRSTTRIASYNTATQRWSDVGSLDACTDNATSGESGMYALSGTGDFVGGAQVRTCGAGAILRRTVVEGGTLASEWAARLGVDRFNTALAVLPGGLVVVAGGGLSGPATDARAQWNYAMTPLVEAYDPESDTWTTLPPLPMVPAEEGRGRTRIGLVAVGGELYAISPADGSTLLRLDLP